MDSLKEQLKPRFPYMRETTHQRPGRVVVWLAIIALWAIGWGQSSIAAVLAIFNARPPAVAITHWGTAVERTAGNLLEGFCVIVLTLILVKHYAGVSLEDAGLSKKSVRTPYAATITIGAYLALLICTTAISDVVGQIFPALGTPWYVDAQQMASTPQDNLTQLASSISAGSEEVLFTAGIIVLLYAAGYKPWIAWTAAILLRTSFHLYYFPDMLWVPLWAAGTIYIYQRFGCIWTMVTVHILYDVGIDLDRMIPDFGWALNMAIAIFYGLVVLLKILRSPKKSR
ncbi:CPBP family intramembrane glutamic endopeptidase [Glutamicibacter ardleyensis]|uniref:CPBP family intramembrane glutamic endopeptidase n=1 Tax=Glutamicibacter ardleyensis TaxID=225894 RepID=UPI003FD64D45